MNLFAGIDRGELLRVATIATTALGALLAILAGLLAGITTAIPHLLYIPVVIASYWYPRRGAAIAAAIAGLYLLEVILVIGTGTTLFYEALLRVLVVIAIGWIIALLTLRLREQENLYKGLFEHSEAGSILITDAMGSRTIERANWMAAKLLKRPASGLISTPVTALWSGEDSGDFFSRLSSEGAVYAMETRFRLPEERTFITLVSAAMLSDRRAILTFFDITDRVRAEEALLAANDKLNLLSRFSTDHLHRSVDEILETVEDADVRAMDSPTHAFLERIRILAWGIVRQLFLTESYKDLGTLPPAWIGVQEALSTARLPPTRGSVAIRIWAERLWIQADPLFTDVLTHLLENPLRYSNDTVNNIVVTYHETGDGLDLIFQDDGAGIPFDMKDRVFDYDAGGHAGIGIFVCRQIVEVTGMTLTENGTPGYGARFVIHVPVGRYRIEGTKTDAPAVALPSTPYPFAVQYGPDVTVRELVSSEFPIAADLWVDYHNTTGDVTTDRIFAAFTNGKAVSLARCRRHPDGLEVDGVFTPVNQRGHGYATAVVRCLIEACGGEMLYMHSVLTLTGFYQTFGFVSIDEKELPQTIRDRFAWAGGEMEGANVMPMKREISVN